MTLSNALFPIQSILGHVPLWVLTTSAVAPAGHWEGQMGAGCLLPETLDPAGTSVPRRRGRGFHCELSLPFSCPHELGLTDTCGTHG